MNFFVASVFWNIDCDCDEILEQGKEIETKKEDDKSSKKESKELFDYLEIIIARAEFFI